MQKATTRAHRQQIAMQPEVARRIAALTAKYTKGKRKSTLLKEENAKKIKTEKRAEGTAAAMMMQMAASSVPTTTTNMQSVSVTHEELQILLQLRSGEDVAV